MLKWCDTDAYISEKCNCLDLRIYSTVTFSRTKCGEKNNGLSSIISVQLEKPDISLNGWMVG